ncbi:MAG: phenylalanine--tRNA ligase subunit beta [Acidiferrobacteraceae bacterium]|jgi:phenylalanyl-tRNA synthetase beta chain
MKLGETWLREWVSPKMDTRAIAETLTMAGLEVDSVEAVAPPLARVVVGRVVSVEPHPNAEKLKVCAVDVGRTRPLRIVCGAANVREGLAVAVALTGARLPGGKKIESTELRGVKSSGMLCSAAELGLAEASEGLLELDPDSKPGQDLAECLTLDDVSIDIDLTPNRGDCLSVAGVARELAALTGTRLKQLRIDAVRSRSQTKPVIRIQARRECPHYVGRVIEELDSAARTPLWMSERLRRSGLRAIHPVVDVTNYVMLELGQPMHAFDRAKIDGAIVVRKARAGEKLELLDGKTLALEAGTLLIADRARPLALAGIMGGLDSSVGKDTIDIVLESAFFQPSAIAGRARSLGLHTDSSHRFERGVDPALQRRAIERATRLLLDIAGGRPGPVVEETVWAHMPRRAEIRLHPEKVERLLGVRHKAAQIESMLRKLGMNPRKLGNGWKVTAPSYRFDIEREVDLVEEIARVGGYDSIPPQRPTASVAPVEQAEDRMDSSRIRNLMADRGYQEVINYSFVDPDLQSELDPEAQAVPLANPLSADLSVMRSSLWPGLVRSVVHNSNRQLNRIRLFELGRCFRPGKRRVAEHDTVAAAATGTVLPLQWGSPARELDFFDLKGDLQALLGLTNFNEFRFESATHSALHPGQTARILRKSEKIGWIGRLHPRIQANLGVESPIFLFELEYSAIQDVELPEYRPVSRFPAIYRDLAVVVDESVPAQDVLDCAVQAAGELLVNLELFDEYRGEGIDSGRKSLGLGLTLQDSSRTLNEDIVETVVNRVVGALSSELAARLRQ